MGASEKHDAAWHGTALCGHTGCPFMVTHTDLGWRHVDTHGVETDHDAEPMTAQPKPTAADVDPPTVGHLRDLWVDWHLDPLPRSQGVALVPAYQAEFDRWLAEHDTQVLRAWGESLLGRYPEDVFTPPSQDAYDRVHRARGATGVSLDALSADAMRRAARLAIQDADRIAGGST